MIESPVTNGFLIVSLFLSGLSLLDIVPYEAWMWNRSKVFTQFQLWRPITSALVVRSSGINFFWRVMLMKRYMHHLETNFFTSSKKFALRLGLILVIITGFNIFVIDQDSTLDILRFSISYIWAKTLGTESILPFINIQASFYPWLDVVASLLLRRGILKVLLAMLLGHSIYFYDYVIPQLRYRNIIK